MFSESTTASFNQTTSVRIEQDSLAVLIYHYGGFALITCINIPGNLSVITTFMRNEALRDPANYFIVGLASSDLLIAASYPTYVVAHIQNESIQRDLGNWAVCRWVIMQIEALELSSSYQLLAITISRYVAICHPFHYQMYLTKRVGIGCVLAIWVSAQTITFFLYCLHEPGPDYDNSCKYEKLFDLTHITIWFFVILMLPLFIMFVLYLRIVKIARQQARAIAAQDRSEGSDSNKGKEWKATIMVAFLLVCFASGWLPMITYFFVTNACSSCASSPYIRASIRIMLYLNSAVNVFVYAFRLEVFRNAVKKDLKKICCCLCRKY